MTGTLDRAQAVAGQLKLFQAMSEGATFQNAPIKGKPEIKEGAETYRDFKFNAVTTVIALTSHMHARGTKFEIFTVNAAGAAMQKVYDLITKVAQTDDPTAQVQIFAPAGYTIATAAPDTTLGKASGTVFARDTGLTLPLDGTVVAADPAQYVVPPNNQCSPGTHFAVWLLKLSVAGQTITVPIYVDPTTGTQTGLGAYKMVACFSAPDTPKEAPNHAPFGAQLLDANFTVDSAITLPASTGTYVWRTLFTPYTPGTGVPNAAGTREARSFVGLPAGTQP